MDKLLNIFRRELSSRGIVKDRDDLLLDQPSAMRAALAFLKQSIGGKVPDFASRTLAKIESRRDEWWRERTKTLSGKSRTARRNRSTRC